MRSFGSLFTLRSLCCGLLSISAILPMSLQAKHLQPAEALSAALQTQVPAKAPSLQAKSLELCYQVSLPDYAEAAVYVFSRTDGGFAIVAANDDAPQLLLGYSDTSTLDINNMPPAFKWAMQQYAAYVQCAIEHVLPASTLARVPANYAPISPICKTTWDQSAPYNNDCPMVNGQRSVTGCVATAMAQLMKVHNWPKTGTGKASYTFDNDNYSDSFDFGNTTFDWDNMLDSYSQGYTTAQGNAVATLMHACGVAAQMDYSPTESGSNDFTIAQGVIKHMNYDKQLTYYMRNWFTSDEWENIIYDQLSQGLPIMLCGVNDQDEGHAFVCDGCDDANYFHINWGWSGYYDGYFSLSDLYPTGSGIGGGSGDSGFNNDQSILTNLKPAAADSEYNPIFVLFDTLATEQNEYWIMEGNNVEFMPTSSDESEGGFFSFSLGDINATLGFKFDIPGNPQYIEVVSNNFEPESGYEALGVPTTSFPQGEYNVSAVYKPKDGEWQPMYYNLTQGCGSLHFVVGSEQITISQPTSAISSINADSTVPAYYNMQGIKLPRKPESGMYIRVDGNKGKVRL